MFSLWLIITEKLYGQFILEVKMLEQEKFFFENLLTTSTRQPNSTQIDDRKNFI